MSGKATRYRAGQVPKYAREGSDEYANEADEGPLAKTVAPSRISEIIGDAKGLSIREKQEGRRRRTYEAEIVSRMVSESEEEEEYEEEDDLPPISISEREDEATRRRRQLAQEKTKEKLTVPVIISTGDDDDSEDEDEVERRRARARAKARQRKDEETLPREMEDEEKEEEEKEDEYEEVSDYESDEEEIFPTRPRIAPVFKRKEERETVNEVLQLEQKEEMMELERQKRLEERKKQSKELYKQEIERSKELDVGDEEPDDEPDDEGDGDEAEEYEKWKVRELARIKAEREERKTLEKEKKEIERRRQMTDKEIMEEDKDRLAPREKKQWNYLQKYYHKGAYYRTFDEKDEIANRWDFSQPTLEDRVDKSVLPEVLQVKNFGKSGRVKWTHLTNEDTTSWDSGWAQKDAIRSRYKRRMGGMGSVGEKSYKRSKR